MDMCYKFSNTNCSTTRQDSCWGTVVLCVYLWVCSYIRSTIARLMELYSEASIKDHTAMTCGWTLVGEQNKSILSRVSSSLACQLSRIFFLKLMGREEWVEERLLWRRLWTSDLSGSTQIRTNNCSEMGANSLFLQQPPHDMYRTSLD